MSQQAAQSPDTGVAAPQIAATLLRDSYGLPGAQLTFLGGEVDRNYRVSASDGRTFLAKLRPTVDRDGELQWQKDILLHLAGRNVGVAVPTLVRTLDGQLDVSIEVESGRWLLTVLNWLPGTDMVRAGRHSDGLLTDVGVTAAKVTRALTGFESASLHTTHHWDITRAADVIEECVDRDPSLEGRADAEITLRWFSEVRSLLGTLPTAMVHNDLNDNNLLVGDRDGEQRVVGVLDFNDALHTVRVAEPAIASAYAMLRKDDPLTAMGLVIAGYHGVTPLTDDELTVAYPLAAARLAVQALTWGLRAQHSPTEYGAMRMQHTLPTLRRIVAIDPHDASRHLHRVCGRHVETRG